MKELLGAKVIEKYLQTYPRLCAGKVIQIIRFSFEPGNELSLIVSDLSTSEKINILLKFGFSVRQHSFPLGVSIKSVNEYIKYANDDRDIKGIVIQNPVPRPYHICCKQISSEKDLDAYDERSRFKVPITVEVIYRLLTPFFQRDISLAIIGSKGYIGSKLYKLINDQFQMIIAIDKEQPLYQAGQVQIVVSAAGCAGLVSKKQIRNHMLLGIDVGVSIDPSSFIISGDFEAGVCGYFDFFTPVPGGVGPLSMAILVERSYQVCGIEIPKRWSFEELVQA